MLSIPTFGVLMHRRVNMFSNGTCEFVSSKNIDIIKMLYGESIFLFYEFIVTPVDPS